MTLWLTVDGLNCWGINRQRRYPPLKTRLKVIKILHLHHQPQQFEPCVRQRNFFFRYFFNSFFIKFSISEILLSGTAFKSWFSWETFPVLIRAERGWLSVFFSFLSGIHSRMSFGVQFSIPQSASTSFKFILSILLFTTRVAKLSEYPAFTRQEKGFSMPLALKTLLKLNVSIFQSCDFKSKYFKNKINSLHIKNNSLDFILQSCFCKTNSLVLKSRSWVQKISSFSLKINSFVLINRLVV